LKSHYATKKNFIVGDLESLKAAFADKKVGIISFSTIQSEGTPHVVLSSKGDLAEAASKLFAAMREMDSQNVDLILAEWVPDQGIGRAINDRLKRAIH
jgi:L-threonylcarbamoyladenylate synthase